MMESKLIISIEEAREILGEVAQKMTDEQIEHTIRSFDEIARWAICNFRELKVAKANQEPLE